MKNLLFLPALALSLTAFKAGSHLPVPGRSPVVGVWKNINRNESIKMVKFFPNGLMSIADSTDNYITSYKLIQDSTDVLQGQINWHSTDVPFRAQVANKVMMELTLNYFGQEKVIHLVKTKDIKSGVVLLNGRL